MTWVTAAAAARGRPSGEVVIAGVGARVATGVDALTTAMSVRAGKSVVRESRFVDRAGEPIALAWLASMGEALVGRERFVGLAAPALAECARGWAALFAARGHPAPALPLVLAIPAEADPDDPRGGKLLAAVAERSGVAIDAGRSRVVAQGRAGGAAAIEQAAARLAKGEEDAVLVGGVDSWFDPERLEDLDRDRRLHAPGAENGFVPGEGAAFVLLVARRRAGELPRFASVVGAATEREPRPYGSPDPCHALGITIATKRAIAGAAGAKIGWALTDVVFERHRVEEWLYAEGRVQGALAPEYRHDQPLILTGDLGAASAPALVAMACVHFSAGSAPADLALVAAHSDSGERGAILLAAEGAS
jgi:3-oxoacyl-[acyl-carrier-protein] synthase-1